MTQINRTTTAKFDSKSVFSGKGIKQGKTIVAQMSTGEWIPEDEAQDYIVETERLREDNRRLFCAVQMSDEIEKTNMAEYVNNNKIQQLRMWNNQFNKILAQREAHK